MRIALVLLVLVSSCAQKSDDGAKPANPLTASPEPAAIAPSPTATPRKVLADLVRFAPTVNYKRKSELSWQAVEPRLEFERSDSVQTQGGASAEIQYRSGSTLRLRENTLVVIEENSGARGPAPEDRAYVDSGRVQGRTSGELWLLTSRGLVKIKGARTRPARVTVVAKPREGVKVTLEEGRAALIARDDAGVVTTKVLAPREEIAVSPATGKAPEWEGLAKAAREAPVEAEAPLTMELDEPRDQAVIAAAEVTVKGRLSQDGGKILINGKPAAIERRAFSASVGIVAGANVISVQLIRPDGTTEFKRITVLGKKSGEGP